MKTIPLTKGCETIVDDEDYEWLSRRKWCCSDGYAVRGGSIIDGERRGKMIIMHREIMYALPGQVVDHINGNKLDNRRSNLRLCTDEQNHTNINTRKSNYSKHKGVRKSERYWMAYISNHGIQEYLGFYNSEIEAARAYNIRAIELFGDFASLNDVPDDIVPKRRTFRDRSSGEPGVTWDKHRSKWRARTRINGRDRTIGRYTTEEEAIEMLKRVKQEHWVDPRPFRD